MKKAALCGRTGFLYVQAPCSAARHPFSVRYGFTFIELIVGMVVVGILISAGYPALHRAMAWREYNRSLQMIMSDMRRSREYSMNQREEIRTGEDMLFDLIYGLKFENSEVFRTILYSIGQDIADPSGAHYNADSRRHLSVRQFIGGGGMMQSFVVDNADNTTYRFDDDALLSIEILFDSTGKMLLYRRFDDDEMIKKGELLKLIFESPYLDAAAEISLNTHTGAFELTEVY